MSERQPELTEAELETLLQLAGARSGELLPTTSAAIAVAEEAQLRERKMTTPEWIAGADAFERLLKRGVLGRAAAQQADSQLAENFARAAREGSGEIPKEILERMRQDRLAAQVQGPNDDEEE